jgi:CRP-like cAMP-binding protein
MFQNLKAEELRQATSFSGCSDAFITTVTDFFQVKTFVAGERIMNEGDDGDQMYFVHHGKVDVLVGPKHQKVAVLEAGCVVGEMALLGAPKCTATIQAAEFCDCRVLDKHTFHLLLKKFPGERAFFHQMAKDRMEQVEQLTRDNPSRKSFFRLPSLHTEGKQQLQKNYTEALPPACQTAVNKFLAVRRKSTGGLAARYQTAPCLSNSEPHRQEKGSGQKILHTASDKTIDEFLASRPGPNASGKRVPRNINDSLHQTIHNLGSDSSSEEDEEKQERYSFFGRLARDYREGRRLSAPDFLPPPTLEKKDAQSFKSEGYRLIEQLDRNEKHDCEKSSAEAKPTPAKYEDRKETYVDPAYGGPSIVEVGSHSTVEGVSRRLPPRDDGGPYLPSTVSTTSEEQTMHLQAPADQRRFMSSFRRHNLPKAGDKAGSTDHKALLYNIVACNF